MQNTSQTYKNLRAAGVPYQVRVIISNADGSGSVTYSQDHIVSATVKAFVFDDEPATVGACTAKRLNLVLHNVGEIPRMARIRMQFRLWESNQSGHYSAWYPKGTYYIDTRSLDAYGRLSIEAYDPMLKGEQSFAKPGPQGTWPRLDTEIVQTIRQALGVELDNRTAAILTKHYQINYPGITLEDGTPTYSDSGAMSMRKVLGYIGAMYGGNWIITDEDKLRLIVLGDIPDDSTNYLIDEHGYAITIGGYRILVR